MTDFEMIVEHRPRKGDIERLRQCLVEHNTSYSRIGEGQDLAVFLMTAENEMAGGVYGWIWGECFEIHYLWVRPDIRGRGYGSRMLAAVEGQAARQGCAQAVLETFSFQAPEFYGKMGYETWGTIDGYPDQTRKYFMKKRLPVAEL